jgi:hypothetical protein
MIVNHSEKIKNEVVFIRYFVIRKVIWLDLKIKLKQRHFLLVFEFTVNKGQPILVPPGEKTMTGLYFLCILDQNIAVTTRTVYGFKSEKDVSVMHYIQSALVINTFNIYIYIFQLNIIVASQIRFCPRLKV